MSDNDTAGQDKKLLSWLNSMNPGIVNKKEKERMSAAIEFDLEQCVLRGQSVSKRLETLKYLGYLYEGMTFKIPQLTIDGKPV